MCLESDVETTVGSAQIGSIIVQDIVEMPLERSGSPNIQVGAVLRGAYYYHMLIVCCNSWSKTYPNMHRGIFNTLIGIK